MSMNEFDCMYYDKEFNCCSFETDYGQPMPVFKPCYETICKRKESRPLLQKPKCTNFDRTTENEDSLIKWLNENYNCYPEDLPCKAGKECDELNCDGCLKEWLQRRLK